jgi:hypothetical protein
MRVAEHEHVALVTRQYEIGGRTPELVTVADVKRQASDRNRPLARERWIARIVDVAIDGLGRRDTPERIEHAGAADIAGVYDEIDARERALDPWTHEPVRVGDQPHHIY